MSQKERDRLTVRRLSKRLKVMGMLAVVHGLRGIKIEPADQRGNAAALPHALFSCAPCVRQ